MTSTPVTTDGQPLGFTPRDPAAVRAGIEMFGTCYPEHVLTFAAPQYPVGRGQAEPVSGWQCPGCARCYSPLIPMCHFCGGNTTQAATPVMGDWDDDL